MLVTDLSNSFIPYPKNQKNVKMGNGIGQKSNKKESVTDETYNKVMQRDKYKCRLLDCTCYGKLELHHVRYRSERKDLINEPNNCICLCTFHHQLVHSNKKKYQPILLDLIKGGKNNGK